MIENWDFLEAWHKTCYNSTAPSHTPVVFRLLIDRAHTLPCTINHLPRRNNLERYHGLDPTANGSNSPLYPQFYRHIQFWQNLYAISTTLIHRTTNFRFTKQHAGHISNLPSKHTTYICDAGMKQSPSIRHQPLLRTIAERHLCRLWAQHALHYITWDYNTAYDSLQ